MRWKQLFIDWLGELNINNAGVRWWAYTSSAKNVLSSRLGNQIFQVLALCEFAGHGHFETLYVTGAAPGQIEVFRDWARRRPDLAVEAGDATGLRRLLDLAVTLASLLFQFLRVWTSFVLPNPAVNAPRPCDVLLFTYVDHKPREGADTYYGRLATMLAEQAPGTQTAYAAYVYAPYRAALRHIASLKDSAYFPIFSELSFLDLVWALVLSSMALRTSAYYLTTSLEQDIRFTPLLRRAMLQDVATGGYFHNLLVHRCIHRIVAKTMPRVFIYPYENKSLEKLLLLALRRHCKTLPIIGFQHTSITPRHTTLLFAVNEAACTPLPDRIITAGEVTRQYLEQYGNYPAGIFTTGCALRQSWQAPARWRPVGDRAPRVLLALSSSRAELIQSVAYFMRLKQAGAQFELGIRPHINFPLSLLPGNLLQWAVASTRDLSTTSLADNIDWCDLTAYVSSTVALEALMAGKPVINFRIGDLLDPDPVLGSPALCWRARDAGEFIAALARIRALSAHEHQQLAADAASYVKSYLRPPSAECVRLFAHAPESAIAPSRANAAAPAAPTA